MGFGLVGVIAATLAWRATHHAETKTTHTECTLSHVREMAPSIFQQAHKEADSGDFGAALKTIGYALSLEPGNADYRCFQGHMLVSLLKPDDAEHAYERAVETNSGHVAAQENLKLIRRLQRVWKQGDAPDESSCYALHRQMMEEHRLSEAFAVAKRLKGDQQLWLATWQKMLETSNAPGTLSVDEDGELAMDLSGRTHPDLNLIKQLPLRSLNLAGAAISDISALRGMPLEKLDLTGTQVSDLSPLKGMPLKVLLASRTGVNDLTWLAGLRLRTLDVSRTRVRDLWALKEMPLRTLRLADTQVNDLRAISTIPLIELDLARTSVADLKPLSHLPLQTLNLEGTLVADLSPLKGSPLVHLHLGRTAVRDLKALSGTPLSALDLTDCPHQVDLNALAHCAELERITLSAGSVNVEMLRGLPRLRFITSLTADRKTTQTYTAEQYWSFLRPAQAAR